MITYQHFRGVRKDNPLKTASEAVRMIRGENVEPVPWKECDGSDAICEARFSRSGYDVNVSVYPEYGLDTDGYGEFQCGTLHNPHNHQVIDLRSDEMWKKLSDRCGSQARSNFMCDGWPDYFVGSTCISDEDQCVRFWMSRGMTRHDAQMRFRNIVWEDMTLLLKIVDGIYSNVCITVEVAFDGDVLGTAVCGGYFTDDIDTPWLTTEVWSLVDDAVEEANYELARYVERLERRVQLARCKLERIALELSYTTTTQWRK